jgi:hypothetical protein
MHLFRDRTPHHCTSRGGLWGHNRHKQKPRNCVMLLYSFEIPVGHCHVSELKAFVVRMLAKLTRILWPCLWISDFSDRSPRPLSSDVAGDLQSIRYFGGLVPADD